MLATALLMIAEASPAATGCEPGRFPIVVDIGHTPEAPGAVSARGVPEYRFNVELAGAVVEALRRAGFANAALLNPEGQSMPLRERPMAARPFAPKLLLSIHHDSVQAHYLSAWTPDGEQRLYSDRFRGYSLFVSHRNGQFASSETAARLLGQSLRANGFVPTLHHAEDVDGERKPLLDPDLGLYAYDGLFILAHDVSPAVLIEAGVLVHRQEEAKVGTDAFRRRFAAAVADGVRAFCAAGTSPLTRGSDQ